MLLDLKPREIALPGGITLVARPLEAWAYLRWLGHNLQELPEESAASGEPEAAGAGSVAAPGAGSAEPNAPHAPPGRPRARPLVRPETHRLAGEILAAHAVRLDGLEVQDGQGRRPGTVQDLVTHGPLAGHVLRALHGLMAASVLTEADAGNSVAPRPPGAPGPSTP